MSKPKQTQPPDGDDLLAAELALGVLEGDMRDAALARREAEPEFGARVEAWSLRLAPLAETLPAKTPPGELKARIEAALFGPPVAEPRRGLWASLAFWRGAAAAFAASTAAAVFLLLAPGDQSPPADTGLYAALQADASGPSVLIRFDPQTRRIQIAGLLGDPAAEPVQPELWVIAPGEAPRSLGLIADVDGALTDGLEVDEAASAAIARGATLAISLEPPGGSPTGAPTGPVIAAGEVRTL
ncbi:MAG: anti-sigma factor [Alphaproteobacteria bacterium]|nr:anti-sigma factor [Alphaproteobacteria bacterium]